MSCESRESTLLGLGENNGLDERVHGCWLTCQTAFEPLLDLVAEGGEGLGVALAYADKGGGERGHKDRAEEERVLGGEGFLVAIVLIVGPGSIREFKHLATFDGELLEFPVSCERGEQIAF